MAKRRTRHFWLAVLFAGGMWLLVGGARAEEEFVPTLANEEVIRQLRQGGYVLYMRHGYTDNSKPDQVPLDVHDCSTQRPLTEAGRQQAAQVGRAIRQARIPIGEVLVSPLCRTRESAQAAFGKAFMVKPQLMYTANLTQAEKQPILAATRQLLATPVVGKSNRVVLAHAPNLFDLMGYFVAQEGTVVVIEPLGGNDFRYVASIPPARWRELLR